MRESGIAMEALLRSEPPVSHALSGVLRAKGFEVEDFEVEEDERAGLVGPVRRHRRRAPGALLLHRRGTGLPDRLGLGLARRLPDGPRRRPFLARGARPARRPRLRRGNVLRPRLAVADRPGKVPLRQCRHRLRADSSNRFSRGIFHEQGSGQGPRRRSQGQASRNPPARPSAIGISRPKARSTRLPARCRRTTATPRKRSRTPSTRSDDGAQVEPIGETPAARQAAASARSMLPLSLVSRSELQRQAARTRAPMSIGDPAEGPRAPRPVRPPQARGARSGRGLASGRKRLMAAYRWRSP